MGAPEEATTQIPATLKWTVSASDRMHNSAIDTINGNPKAIGKWAPGAYFLLEARVRRNKRAPIFRHPHHRWQIIVLPVLKVKDRHPTRSRRQYWIMIGNDLLLK